MEDADPAVHCELADAVDLLDGLESAHIEHLDVDDERTIVIYQSAILMVAVAEGAASTARAFDVELWEPPLDRHRDPAVVLDEFVVEFVDTLSTTRRGE